MENYFDEKAEEWDNYAIHDAPKVEKILDKVSLKKGDTVLDVGSGTGILIPYITEKVGKEGRITAIDISEKMIAISKQKHPKSKFSNVEFINNDIMNIEFTKLYDVIICYSCFPHFSKKMKLIEHLSKGLKKGGKLIIAHSESREKINNRHKEIEQLGSEHLLPTLHRLIEMFEIAQFRIDCFKNTSEVFYVIGNKK
ncbi:MAG: class I SAM-dependent methyltransferase [Candidatus Lokiarchaeota archaeon]